MKKLLALILAIVMCASLVACGGGKTEEPAKTDEPPAPVEDTTEALTPVDTSVEYKEWVWINPGGSDLDSADPHNRTGGIGEIVTTLTFDTITYFDPATNELKGELAYDWESSADNKEWTFYLEEGVTFHNGNPFTAEDIKFTFEYAGTGGTGTVIKPIACYAYVEEIVVVNDYTVKFVLKNGMADFDTYMEIKIYDKETFEALPQEEAGLIGSGPYYYDAEQRILGQQHVYTRYDNYWKGIDNYPTKHIGFKVITDEGAKMNALQTGQIDVLGSGTVTQMPTVEADSNLKALVRPGAQIYHLGFNATHPELAKTEVRKAISQAINKQDIEMIFWEGGAGGVAHDNFCPPSGLGYSENITPLAYDPDAARAVLEPMNLTIGLAVYPACQKLGEVIQANLKDVGVNVDLTIVSDAWNAFKLSGEFDMIAEYGSYSGALLYNFDRFMKTGGSANPYKYSNSEFDRMLEECSTAATYDEMLKKFEELQQFVADEVPYFPLGVANQFIFAQKDVEGIQVASTINWTDFSTVRIPISK